MHSLYLSFIITISLLAEFECGGLFIADDTLWCGAGNHAKTCDDLGKHNDTDSCCRSHDYCPYTFSTSSPTYNGYSINNLVPLSHCDCDLKFSDCLNASPYKKGSHYIYETYFNELLEGEVNCFAYLPCSNISNTYANLWNTMGNKTRRTGQCHNGFKVAVFDSIKDYSQFMHMRPTTVQKELIKHALEANVDSFMSEAKKNAQCLSAFPDEHLKLIKVFTDNFLTKKLATTTTEIAKTTTPTTTTISHCDNGSVSSNVKLFGYEVSESFAVILMGSGFLIPLALLGIYLFGQYAKRNLTRYTSGKYILNNNITDV